MAKGSGPVQYNDLFANDVNTQLTELNSIATNLDKTFQELASSITGMSGKVNVNIKTNATALKDMGDGLKTVDVATRGAATTMTEYAKAVESGTKKSTDLKNQQDLLNKTFNLATASVDEIKARVKLLTAEYNALGGATDANKAKAAALSGQVIGLKNQQDLLTSSLNKTKTGLVQAEGSYNQMNQTLNKLRADLKELPNAIDKQTGAWNKNNPAVKQHLTQINELDKALKKVDGSMGVHTRHVGDYAEQIKQGLFDLLPFGSQLGRVAHAMDNFGDAAKIASIKFGTLTAVMLAIPVVAVGAVFAGLIAYFTSTTEGADKVSLAMNALKVEFTESLGAIQEFGRGLNKDFWGGIGKGVTDLKNTVNKDLLDMGKSLALFAAGLVTFDFKNMGKGLREFLTGSDELNKATLDKSKQITDLQIKIKENDNEQILQREHLNRIAKEQGEIARDAANSEEVRIAAAKKAIGAINEWQRLEEKDINLKIQLLKLEQGLTKEGTMNREGIGKMNALLAEQETLRAETAQKRIRLTSVLNKNEAEIEKERLDAIEKHKKALKTLSDELQKGAEDRLKNIKLYSEAEIKDQEDTTKRINDIQKKNVENFQINIKEFEQIIAERDRKIKVGDEMAEDVAKNDEERIARMMSILQQNSAIIGDLFGAEFGDLFSGLATNLQNFLDGSGNDFEAWANVAKSAIGSIDEAFKQGSQLRISQLELEKQAQIDIAGTNAVARLAIEKEYNDKIKAEKKKQAQIDKAAAVFEIAINTAVAISKTLAETALFGIPLIPIIAALGALQIAAVLARPIPGFKHGTQSAPEGFAQVAEDGAELIENKRGLRIAHKRQVTYLERGDKVFTAEQTRKILDTSLIDSNTELHGRLANNLHQTRRAEQIRDMAIAFRQDPEAIGDAVGRRIKDLPIHQTYFDERGVSRYIRTNGTRTKYLDDRFSLK